MIVNEVAQYFPSVDYIARVVEGAVSVTRPGGFIFLGGIRSQPLLEAFHSSVALYQAGDSLPIAELRQEVQRRMGQDKELVVAPELFAVLAQRLGRVDEVSVQLRGGWPRNELTKFRYDVVLRVRRGEEKRPQALVLHWESEVETLSALRHRLAEQGSSAVIVRGIPNARLVADVMGMELLSSGVFATVAELREALQRMPPVPAIDPVEVWDLARESGWEVEIGWSEQGLERMDACFCRPGSARPAMWVEPSVARGSGGGSLRRYGNDPASAQVRELAPELVPQLRTFAAERLPAPMVPAAFVLLESLPLTANGKLDRKRLPAPEGGRPKLDREYVAPRTPVEEVLAGIWAEVLGIEQVGVSDNFFDLGGHSLLATQVTARVRQWFSVELALRSLFEKPTVAALAVEIEASLGGAGTPAVPSIVAVPRTGALPVSFAQQRLWFLDQLNPDSGAYNISASVLMRGELDRGAGGEPG